MKDGFLAQIIQKEKFNPGLLGFFMNHNFLIRIGLVSAIKKLSNDLSGDILDFGCGSKPYEFFFKKKTSYVGIDYKIEGREDRQKKVDFFYDGQHIPFENESFDAIICTEVLEHVFNIEQVLSEFNRVLKKGGKALITTPFMWEEHEMPYDFARYTTPALTDLYQKAGFSVVNNQKSGNYVEVINQFQINYIKNILPKNKIIRQLLMLPFIFFFNLKATIFSFLLPNEQTAYFNNVFLLEKR